MSCLRLCLQAARAVERQGSPPRRPKRPRRKHAALQDKSSGAAQLSLHSHARMRLKGKEDKSHSSPDAIGRLQPESSQCLHSHSGT